jgi:hypothetical protein
MTSVSHRRSACFESLETLNKHEGSPTFHEALNQREAHRSPLESAGLTGGMSDGLRSAAVTVA